MHKFNTFAWLMFSLVLTLIIISFSSCKSIQEARKERKDNKVYNQAITRPSVDKRLEGHYIDRRKGYDTSSVIVRYDTSYKEVKVVIPKIIHDTPTQNAQIKKVQDELAIRYNDPFCKQEIHDAYLEGLDYSSELYNKAIDQYRDTVINTFTQSTVQDRKVMDYQSEVIKDDLGQIKQLKEDKSNLEKKARKRLYIIIGIIAIILGIAGLKLWLKYRPASVINPVKLSHL